ncbi:MAG: hypothetical protein DLM52_09145 [Chthoniobacterales bacterium]|nr:MAG: hypothetical protein DLM52_09145 [Chthoniobacterales bacterium]
MAALVVCTTGATTVIPPSFDDLVSRAQIIFQGTVTGVRSEWIGEGAQRHIVSYVTFKVEDALKGNPGPEITLRMLGGTVAGQTMEVTDAPKFKAGDRDVLFVENNGTQFIPLVGIMHGRYHVRKDANGQDTIYDNTGSPVSSTEHVGKAALTAAAAAAGAQAMTLQQFKQAVVSRAGQLAP